VGVAGSGIDPQLLEPGRAARIRGIVRRAHPSATDQRFALMPRSRKDVRLGRLAPAGNERDHDDRDADDDDDGLVVSVSRGGDAELAAATTLATIGDMDDRLVRVGGRLAAVDGRTLVLDDGTARGYVRLPAAAVALASKLRAGEVLNAVGQVRRRAGRHEVVVRHASDVRRAAVLGTASAGSGPPAGGPDAAPATVRADVAVDGGTAAPAPAAQAPRPLSLVLLAGLLATAATGLLGAAGLVAWSDRRRDVEAAPE
jgi:hypothetical protein